jgi:hypothetical protein
MAGACVLIFCRWMIGLAFAVSAVGKASALASFRSAISEFGIVPRRLTGAAALASVVAEGAAVILVTAGGVFADAGFSLAAVLLAIFSVVLGRALRHEADVSCHCFGPSERRVSRYDLARNGVLGLCCVGGLWAWPAQAGQHPGPGLIVALGLMGACALLIAVNLEDFVELLRKPYLVG